MSVSFVNHEKWADSFGSSQGKIVYRKEIGKGSYGEVWSAEWNRKEVAAKRIHGEFFRREYGQEITNHYIGEFRKEWEILRKLDHPNIVKMHTVLFPPNESPVIVMELMHCDLLNYIKNSTSTPKVSPSKGLSIALGVVEGLKYLHGLKPPVVHRDIATKNILLTVDGQPKIADLGVAKVFAAGKEAFATVGPGTPVYSAPETYLNVSGDNRAKYGVKVDIFSFGVVLLAINVGHEPVVLPVTHRKEGKKISEVERRENDLQQMEDARLKRLVIACLQEKSSNRPHASTIVKELQNIKVEQEGVECDQHVHFEKVHSQTSPDHHFKVLLLGNRDVGKSCLFELLENPAFKIAKRLKTTSSIHSKVHWFKYDSSYVELELVDTSGEERWFAMTSSYYRDVDGVFLVYDVSNKESFENLPYWINNVNKYTTKDCVQMVLVGNKVDLRESKESRDIVSQERGRQYLKFSPKEDDIILHAISLYGRGDYQRIISALVERASELPQSTSAFYCNPSVSSEQKRNRIYMRQKTLLNSTSVKEIECQWVQQTNPLSIDQQSNPFVLPAIVAPEETSIFSQTRNPQSFSADDQDLPVPDAMSSIPATLFAAPKQSPKCSQTQTITSQSYCGSANLDLPQVATSSLAIDNSTSSSIINIKEHEKRYRFPTHSAKNPQSLMEMSKKADRYYRREKRQNEDETQDNALLSKKPRLKDIRNDNTKMMNQALKVFPTMIENMMEMMERERQQDRDFKMLMMKMIKKNEEED